MERLNQYERNENIYKGNHLEVWGNGLSKEQKEKYITHNYARLIPNFFTDLLTSKNPHFVVQNEKRQEWVDSFTFNEKIQRKITGFITWGLVLGDAVIRTTYRKRNKRQGKPSTTIDFIHPKYYFPIFSEWDQAEIEENVLIFEKENKEGTKIRRIERDTYNKYITTVEEKRKGQKDYTVVSKEEINHSEGFLIQYVKFTDNIFDFWGQSIYKDLEGIFKELNYRTTTIKMVLDAHGNPRILVPPAIFNELFGGEDELNKDNEGRVYGTVGDLDVWLYDEEVDGNKPEYLEWDGKIEAAMQFFKEELNALAVLTGLTTDILRTEDRTTAKSGTALKVSLLQALNFASKIEKIISNPLKEALYKAQKLEIKYGNELKGEAEWVEIIFNRGLPVDKEETEIELMKYREKIQSKKMTMKKVNNLNSRQLEQEKEDIKEDIQEEIHSMGRRIPPLDINFDE